MTYNVFVDGELIYLGYDRQTALALREIALAQGKTFVRATAIGAGYSYDL